MSPFCEKILIAGSIRREKADCRDIEIVALPKYLEKRVETGNLFEPIISESFNLLFDWATETQTRVRWIKPGTSEIIAWQPKPDGKYWRGIFGEDGEQIKLDLFLAGKANFGVIQTIRTGDAAFSQALVSVIKHQTPFRVADGHLTVEATGEIIACETEVSFFKNAGLKFVAVADRSSENPYKILELEK